MTTLNPIPPHVIEKWRSEFEEVFKVFNPKTNLSKDKNGNYIVNKAFDGWTIFQAARVTAEVELPAFQLMDDPDGQGRGEYVMREILEVKLLKQGYRVAGEK